MNLLQCLSFRYNKWRAYLRILANHSEELNRRVDIENELLLISQGKLPLPSREDCKIMALKLGTPKQYWKDSWRNRA